MRLARMMTPVPLLVLFLSVAACTGPGGGHGRQPEPSAPPPARPAVNPFQAGIQARSYTVTLAGTQQRGAGRAAASAVIMIRPADDQVCWSINHLAGVPDPLFAYIHRGAVGVLGPVVMSLGAGYAVSGCAVGVAPALLARLEARPGGYYLAIHTRSQLAGAVRGQL